MIKKNTIFLVNIKWDQPESILYKTILLTLTICNSFILFIYFLLLSYCIIFLKETIK